MLVKRRPLQSNRNKAAGDSVSAAVQTQTESQVPLVEVKDEPLDLGDALALVKAQEVESRIEDPRFDAVCEALRHASINLHVTIPSAVKG